MGLVLLALVPGVIAMTWYFGWGILINLALAISSAVIAEAAVLKLRGRSPGPVLIDLSAVVTGWLLALALPALYLGTFAWRTPVVRREAGKLIRYVHLGTGNYHHASTNVYTDYGYLSSSQRLGEDVHKLFLQLTSLTEASGLQRMYASPFTLFDALIAKIQRERDNAQAGKDARIVAKINSLNEPQLIDALYEASQAGVKIDLIIRGICCLRPGIKGVSAYVVMLLVLFVRPEGLIPQTYQKKV